MSPEGFRQDRHPVLVTLAGPHRDLAVVEVDILDAQAQTFHLPHAGAVNEAGDQTVDAGGFIEQPAHFRSAQHHGQSLWLLSPNHIIKPVKLVIEHLLVEGQDGRKRLVLCGGCHLSCHCKVRQEGRNLLLTHLVRMALVVEQDETADPLYIGLLGSQALMPDPNGFPDAVEQPRLIHSASLQTLKFRLGNIIWTYPHDYYPKHRDADRLNKLYMNRIGTIGPDLSCIHTKWLLDLLDDQILIRERT